MIDELIADLTELAEKIVAKHPALNLVIVAADRVGKTRIVSNIRPLERDKLLKEVIDSSESKVV